MNESSIDSVLIDLKRMFQSQAEQSGFSGSVRLTKADIEGWRASIGPSRSLLYDEVALGLARGFHSSELTFEFCDAVMNGIHGFITCADEVRPDLFWKV